MSQLKSLNHAPEKVLQALLSGAGIDPVVSSNSLTPAMASAIADQIQTYLKINVVQNRADLVSMAASLNPGAGLNYKRQQEVIVRALADVSNTRTWNLLVDVVAQAGTFPPNADPSSAAAFVVQGEQRMWTHTAIDRPTGKVISRTSEACPE